MTPYPLTPQAGLVGLVNAAGGVFVVTVVVNVVSDCPFVDVAAQYPVPYTFLHWFAILF